MCVFWSFQHYKPLDIFATPLKKTKTKKKHLMYHPADAETGSGVNRNNHLSTCLVELGGL